MNIGKIKNFEDYSNKAELENVDVILKHRINLTRDDATELALPRMFSEAMGHYKVTVHLGFAEDFHQLGKGGNETYIYGKLYKIEGYPMSFISTLRKYIFGQFYFFWVDEQGNLFVEVANQDISTDLEQLIKIPLTNRG